MRAFAEQAAMALEQARLFTQLGERNEEIARQKDELTERSDVIRDIVYALAHDLRTPLAAAHVTMNQALSGAYGELPERYSEILKTALAANDESAADRRNATARGAIRSRRGFDRARAGGLRRPRRSHRRRASPSRRSQGSRAPASIAVAARCRYVGRSARDPTRDRQSRRQRDRSYAAGRSRRGARRTLRRNISRLPWKTMATASRRSAAKGSFNGSAAVIPVRARGLVFTSFAGSRKSMAGTVAMRRESRAEAPLR